MARDQSYDFSLSLLKFYFVFENDSNVAFYLISMRGWTLEWTRDPLAYIFFLPRIAPVTRLVEFRIAR